MRISLVGLLVLAALAQVSPAHAAGPSVSDCLSATESSLKLRADHKLRAARAALLVCSAATCPADVRQECMRRIDTVNTALPTVVFTVKTGTGQELSAVKVTMDDEVVATYLEGTALSLDPGSHRFAFEVPGQPPVTETLILHEGEKNRREVVLMSGQATPPAAGAAPAVPTTTAAPSSASSPVEPSDSGHGRRIAGLVVGGAGVVGVVLGGVFGGLTFSAWSNANNECPSHTGCSTKANNDRSDSVTYGTVSTVALIAGGSCWQVGSRSTSRRPRTTSRRSACSSLQGGRA